MSDAKKKAKKGKDPKSKKGKKGKGSAGGGEGTSVATHARARASVRRAKAWGGLGGFAIALMLSLKAGVPADQLGLRALGAGVAGYLVAWACAVTVWRHLLLAELHALVDDALRERDEKSAPAQTPGSSR